MVRYDSPLRKQDSLVMLTRKLQDQLNMIQYDRMLCYHQSKLVNDIKALINNAK